MMIFSKLKQIWQLFPIVLLLFCLIICQGFSETHDVCETGEDKLCAADEPEAGASVDIDNGNPSGNSGFDENIKTDEDRLFRLDGVEIGHKQRIQLESGQEIELHTASMKPQIIEIPNFLSPEECEHFINEAQKSGLKSSETVREKADSGVVKLLDVNKDRRLSLNEMMLTIEDSFDIYLNEKDILEMYKDLDMDKNGDEEITPEEMDSISLDIFAAYLSNIAAWSPVKQSRFSKQVWLFPDTSTDQIFMDIQNRVQEVTRLPSVMIKKSDFQVVTYPVGGHYNAHHDSNDRVGELPCCTRTRTQNCRICRLMTVLFYLNDVEEGGGTAFPMAGNETYNEQVFREEHQGNLQRNCHSHGLVVRPEAGKAIIWYNHHIDPETGWVGKLDKFTWHGGCPVVRGKKWIANFWIKYTDEKQQYLQQHDEL